MEKYEVIESIGKGSFGQVAKIRRKSDNKILVWKEICYGKMKEKEKQQLVSEVNILRELRHPNIVKYYDRIIDKGNSKIFIVMEYCEKGDMGQLIKKCKRESDYLSEDVIWKIFMQVLLGLQACHTRASGKILHRDIKPGNVLLDAGMNVKLGDFGLSKILGEQSIYAETRVGTPYYMSPEQTSDSRYNEKSDIWSAGCLLFEMATLEPPFKALTLAELAQKIRLGHTERIPQRYSEELQRVIQWMMAVDYTLRPTVNDVLNLPQIQLRIREKQIREDTQKFKDLETRLKERMDAATAEKEELEKRLQEIERREKAVNERIKGNEREEFRGEEKERVRGNEREEFKGEKEWEGYSFESKRKVFYRDNGLEVGRNEEEKVLKRENTYDYDMDRVRINESPRGYRPEPIKESNKERTDAAEHYRYESPDNSKKVISYENRTPIVKPPIMQKEKSFENLVQEGLERARRDTETIKVIENSRRPAIHKQSPHRITHNNSAPDIPKPRYSPSIPSKDSPVAQRTPSNRVPYSVKSYKEDLEKEKSSYTIFKEIEQRYKNRTSPGPNYLDRHESPSLLTEIEQRYKNQVSPSIQTGERRENSHKFNEKPPLMKDLKDSPMNNYRKDVPVTRNSPSTYEKNASPLVRYSPNSNSRERIYKEEAPVVRKVSLDKDANDYRSRFSPKAGSAQTAHRVMSAGKANAESPSYPRRLSAGRKESPRYAEPVRKNTVRKTIF